jgi:hypothetical protein
MGRHGTEGTQNKPIVIDDVVDDVVEKSKNKRKSSKVYIDLTAFDEANDPVLEKELAEIALSGRIGTFSTSASDNTRDMENGRGRYAEDAADKPTWRNPAYKKEQSSWRRTLSKMTPSWYHKLSAPEKRKLHLVVILVIVIATIIGVVCGYFIQSDRQKAIDRIISQLTGSKVLKNSSSPQAQAREWLMFDDDEPYTVSEARVVQRYVLASFFFGTGGFNAWTNTNWLNGNECAEGQEWHGIHCNERGEVRTLVQGTLCRNFRKAS